MDWSRVSLTAELIHQKSYQHRGFCSGSQQTGPTHGYEPSQIQAGSYDTAGGDASAGLPSESDRICVSTRSITASGVEVPAVTPTMSLAKNHSARRSDAVST